MLSIKHIASGITISPMSNNNVLFGESTVPNSPATHCCLVRAANTTAMRQLGVSAPVLTDLEYTAATDAQLADSANWSVEEKARCEVSTEEIHAKRDAIRGYTEADVAKYIEDNSVEAVEASEGVEAVAAVVVTDAEARVALHKKDFDILTRVYGPVAVPADSALLAELTATKELAAAKQRVDALIASGHLVTDLSALAEDGVTEIHAGWKAQFEVVEVASV